MFLSRDPAVETNAGSSAQTILRPTRTTSMGRLAWDMPPPPESPPQSYQQATYSRPSEIITDPEGTVRAGTLPALVERLTTHERAGEIFPIHLPVFRCHPFLYRSDLYQVFLDDIQVVHDGRRTVRSSRATLLDPTSAEDDCSRARGVAPVEAACHSSQVRFLYLFSSDGV